MTLFGSMALSSDGSRLRRTTHSSHEIPELQIHSSSTCLCIYYVCHGHIAALPPPEVLELVSIERVLAEPLNERQLTSCAGSHFRPINNVFKET